MAQLVREQDFQLCQELRSTSFNPDARGQNAGAAPMLVVDVGLWQSGQTGGEVEAMICYRSASLVKAVTPRFSWLATT